MPRSAVAGDYAHIREGVVIKAMDGSSDKQYGRKVAKSIIEAYLLRQTPSSLYPQPVRKSFSLSSLDRLGSYRAVLRLDRAQVSVSFCWLISLFCLIVLLGRQS